MDYKYYELYKNCKDAFFIRVEIVKYAKDHKIKETAIKFRTTSKTVRKWIDRFNHYGLKGLKDEKRIPKFSPNKIDKYWEEILIREVKKRIENNKRIIVSQIKRKFKIPYSLTTVLKTLRRNNLLKYRRKKRQRKRDLREIKQRYKAFEKIQIDVKYLDDIPEFYDAYKSFDLPRYQITARCIKTGALFYSYMYANNSLNSSIFIYLLQKHLKKYGIDTSKVKIQTDNGGEFVKPNKSLKDSLFTKVVNFIMKSKHLRIPPGAKTWQSDVEASHRLIEDEFYSDVDVLNNRNFFKQAYNYQKQFNFIRNNSYKNGTPYYILKKEVPNISSKILKFRPLILDNKRFLLNNINKMIA